MPTIMLQYYATKSLMFLWFSCPVSDWFFSHLEFLDLWAVLCYGSLGECCWWSLLCLYKVIQWWAVVQLQWSACEQGKAVSLNVTVLNYGRRNGYHHQLGLMQNGKACPGMHLRGHIIFFVSLSILILFLVVISLLFGLRPISKDKLPVILLFWAFICASWLYFMNQYLKFLCNI